MNYCTCDDVFRTTCDVCDYPELLDDWCATCKTLYGREVREETNR